MNGRIFAIITSMIVFLLVAFTPIVSLMLTHYGVTDAFAIKTVIGLLTLACGYFFVSALLNREREPKEGERGYRLVPLFVGLAIIMITWYTDLPLWLADWSGVNHYLAGGAKELVPIGTRIWVSILTLIGILLIKLGFYRTKEEDAGRGKKKKIGKRQSDEDDGLYDTISDMGNDE